MPVEYRSVVCCGKNKGALGFSQGFELHPVRFLTFLKGSLPFLAHVPSSLALNLVSVYSMLMQDFLPSEPGFLTGDGCQSGKAVRRVGEELHWEMQAVSWRTS